MSHEYEIQVDVPVPPGDTANPPSDGIRGVLVSWGFDPDGEDFVDDGVYQFWGSRSLGGGKTPDSAHAELMEFLPGAVTRWRCVDYDEWDEVIGEKEEPTPGVLET